MEEKTVPWWRRALSYALDGIRSGFGLFSRSPKNNAVDVPEKVAEQKLNPEEESELTRHSPTIEPIVEIANQTEPLHVPEPAVEHFQPEDDAPKEDHAHDEATDDNELETAGFDPHSVVAESTEVLETPGKTQSDPEEVSAHDFNRVPAESIEVLETPEKTQSQPEEVSGHDFNRVAAETTEVLEIPEETQPDPEEVSGHDFSRAESSAESSWASAPAEDIQPESDHAPRGQSFVPADGAGDLTPRTEQPNSARALAPEPSLPPTSTEIPTPSAALETPVVPEPEIEAKTEETSDPVPSPFNPTPPPEPELEVIVEPNASNGPADEAASNDPAQESPVPIENLPLAADPIDPAEQVPEAQAPDEQISDVEAQPGTAAEAAAIEEPEPAAIEEPAPGGESVPDQPVLSVELRERAPEEAPEQSAAHTVSSEVEFVVEAPEAEPEIERAAGPAPERIAERIAEPIAEILEEQASVSMNLIQQNPQQEAEPSNPVEPAAVETARASEPAPGEPVTLSEQPTTEDATEPPAPIEEPAVQIAPAPVFVPAPGPAVEDATAPQQEPAPPPPPASKPFIKLESRDNEADLSPFSVVVSQVYDGPLDLLLDLIRKQDIDIYDIPIARITAQFLGYVNQLKATDVDVAGEFIYIASLLIHIKSKMLLPRAPAGPDDAAEDPRRELVERLLEHERFKNAAQMLQQKQMLEAATWTNPGMREFQDDAGAEPEIAADTVDLVRVFRDIIERARNRPVINLEEDSVTVGQMIQFLARRLTMEDKPVALRRLLSHTRSERALIAMFLALLELVRLQAILLRQDRAFSEIFIKKHTGFESVMNEGLANARDDWR